MNDRNKLLQRQLKKQFGSFENIPEDLKPFLNTISDTYDHQDKERKMLERSIELSSAEMKELNVTLKKENDENNKVVFEKLNESLSLLKEIPYEQMTSDHITLGHIAETLRMETIRRKKAENELIGVNRMFRVISHINQMIVRAKTEGDIFNDACEIVVDLGKFKTAWVSIIRNKNLNIEASKGAVLDLQILGDMTEILQQEVITRDASYVSNQLSTEILLQDQPSWMTDLKYGSCMILPLRCSGSIIGTFNLYVEQTEFFISEEIALLEEAAGDMSFALDVISKDRQRAITEQRLRSSEWRLRQAQAIAHLGSWSLNFATGIAIWSKEALKIYGIDATQVEQSYESWLSYIHPDDLDLVLEHSRRGRSNFSRTAFFHRIVRQDGLIRHLYSQSDFEFDDQGQPVGLYGVAHDVTDIQVNEQALRDSQADLQAIFANTSEGFILAGLDCTVKAYNNKAREIMAFATGLGICIDHNLGTLAHPAIKGTYGDLAAEVGSGKILQYQFPLRKQHGAIKWFDFILSPVYDSGIVKGMVITLSDITERKLAELSLVESEKRYSDLFQFSPLPMWVFNQKDLRFLDVNQSAIDQYGFSKKEFMGMTIKDIRPDEDVILLHKVIAKNKLKKNPVSQQFFRHKKKNGELIQVEIQSSSLLFQGKKAKLIVARDVTERMRYVNAIERQNLKLKEISWMQSHIIRAPLARIMALVPMIESATGSDEDRMNALKYLRISADELDQVIMNINTNSTAIDITDEL